ncbi:MAG: hypothetical protein IJS53_00975, partial [Clostridia bacterium]|nr:hypothetical protein [Clostridia bacterium]
MNATPLDSFSIIHSLRRADRLLCAAPRDELTPAGQWLRDTARALYGQTFSLRRARRLLRKKEFSRLRAVCEKLAAAQRGKVRLGALCRAVAAEAKDDPWTARELRALPDALGLCLLRNLCGQLPDLLRQHHAWQAGHRLAASAAANRLRALPQDPVTLWRAVDLLSASGDIEAARLLDSRLRETGASPQALAHEAQRQLADAAAAVGGTIQALLSLPQLDGGLLAERCSPACALLRRHGGFGRMDREGRALYLTAASRLSRRLRVPEEQVCRAALSLCEGKDGAEGDPGYYLIENTAALCRQLHKRPVGLPPRLRAKLLALALALGALLFGAAGFFMLSWPGILPFAALGWGFALLCLERLGARLLPRRLLPRLKPECLPEGARALIAVPTVLLSREHALKMCRQLSVLFLANEKAPVDLLLLCDYADADAEDLPEDEDVLRAAASGVAALRKAYGPRFFCLLRRRVPNGEGRFCGRERKRGALLLLGDLLCGAPTRDPVAFTDLPENLSGRYTHVITLDADTFLPAGAAEKLLGAILHPLQRGRVTVIQPRMLTLPLHVRTHAQAVLGGMSGADGYGAAAACLHQDLFGRGSFMGKGIYEPIAFRQAVSGLPEGRILSHDLLEGELAGSALASDIVCFDGHPRAVSGFLRRAHRWTRGDWQLLPFLSDRRLDLLSRLKILDNLRRSLAPFLRLTALLLAAARGAGLPFALAALPLLSPAALA